jgi:hypothetical protein
MKQKLTLAGCVVAGALLANCGGKTIRTDSTVQGHLDVESFPSTPAAVQAKDERGKVTRFDVTDGNFELVLERNHTYRLEVAFADGSEPIVFPRTGGALDLDFKVSSGGSIVALGAVRHFDAAPVDGFHVMSVQSTGQGDVGECVDGFVQGTGEACADDDAKVSCEGGEGDNVEQQGEHQDGETASDGDGECEDGFDLTLGASCVDEPEADPSSPMAVPEHNVPNDFGGCADGEEEGGEED